MTKTIKRKKKERETTQAISLVRLGVKHILKLLTFHPLMLIILLRVPIINLQIPVINFNYYWKLFFNEFLDCICQSREFIKRIIVFVKFCFQSYVTFMWRIKNICSVSVSRRGLCIIEIIHFVKTNGNNK